MLNFLPYFSIPLGLESFKYGGFSSEIYLISLTTSPEFS